MKDKSESQNQTNKENFSSDLIEFASLTFLSFVFWSQFSEAIPALWYIPMNLMAISGVVEPLLFSTMIPFVLGSENIRQLIWESPWTHLVGLIALFSLYVDSLLLSGSMVLVGSGAYLTVIMAMIMNPDAKIREKNVHAIMLGLFTLVVVRFGLSSINPLFLYSFANMTSIILSILSVVVLSMLKTPLQYKKPVCKPFEYSDIGSGVGIGAFLLLNTMFLTEHGVLARWDDAHPFFIGLGMMITFTIGMFISKQSFVRY